MKTPLPTTIRRATTNDAAAFARIMGDDAVLANLMQLPHTSEEVWKTRLADLLAPGKTDLQIVAEGVPGARGPATGLQVIGLAGLHPAGVAMRRRHVMSVGIAVAPEAQGQGVGRRLMQALCDYADRWGQVLRMELQVYADNARAIALYESVGFVREGLHRGYALRDGAYVDSLSMARMHPNPPRIAA